MPYLAKLLITLLLAVPAMSVELFRYRGAANDGDTLEYIFEAGEQNSSNALTKEKAAEITADFMTTFYQVQIGALELLNDTEGQKEEPGLLPAPKFVEEVKLNERTFFSL